MGHLSEIWLLTDVCQNDPHKPRISLLAACFSRMNFGPAEGALANQSLDLGPVAPYDCAHGHIQPYLRFPIYGIVRLSAAPAGQAICKEGPFSPMSFMKDAGHLLRFAFLFVIAFVVFLFLRHLVVPKSFGQYGHYRGAAIAEIAARPVHFAGHDTCETCHADVATAKSGGKHLTVNCEACHGALANHANDPASVQPAKLDTATLCIRCHAASAARPKTFPQITEDHSGGLPCETCHKPHSPAIQTGETK